MISEVLPCAVRIIGSHRKRRFLLLATLAWILGPSAAITRGQSYLQSVGSPSFLTSLPVENGNINASNGNLHLEIPLGTYPQRGKNQDKIMLIYDSAIWDSSSGAWVPNNISSPSYNDPTGGPWGGWRIIHTAGGGKVTYAENLTGFCAPDGGPQYDVLNNFEWTAPDGTQHAFAIQTTNPFSSCGGTDQPSGDAFASDATGYHMYVQNYANSASDVIVYGPDGSKVSPALEDPNGNYFSIDVDSFGNVTGDTLGRAPTVTFSGTTIYYAVPNAQGGTSTYTLKTSYVNICSNFHTTLFADFCGSTDQPWLTELDLPDGSKYSFGYDTGTTAGHYGQLTSMTLPMGGEISYAYANFTDAYGNLYPWINSRTTPDSATPWTYTPQVIGACTSASQVNCRQQLKVTKPNGDTAVYLFTVNGGAWSTQVQSYSGAVSSANLLSTTNECYNFVTVTDGQCTYDTSTGSPATNVQISVTSTSLPMAGATTITKTVGYVYDSNNNPTQISGWKFYSGTLPSNPDRSTCISYVTSSSYLNANILNLASSVTVVDNWSSTPCNSPPTAHIVAQTNYSYDGGSLTSVTGVKNHDDTNYGTGNTIRGNITQIQRLASGSNYLTRSMAYDTTGQLHSSTDWSNGNTTTFSYTDNFFNDSGNTTGPTSYSSANPTNAYLTSFTTPLITASTVGYYFGTGQLASVTDPNGKTEYAHFYDSLSRPTAVSLPNGGWSLAQYNSTETQADEYVAISGGTSPTPSCTSCRHDEALLDGLGRQINQILVSDPDGQTTTAITYDSNGRLGTLSNPYRSTSDSTYGIETPSFDGLDRTIQLKHADNNIVHSYYGSSVSVGGGTTSQNCSASSYGVAYPVLLVDEAGNKRQTWADGFARIIEADEPNSSGSLSVGTCYSYDLNDNLTQVTSAATTPNQTRSYTYDMVSRLTSTTTPESGTTNLYYTASGGALCSGDLNGVCRRTDARSITTTYVYDALNRLTSTTYNDTPTTPSVTYSYDQTSYNGLTITNGKGRRTGMSDGSGLTAWSYDSVGSILSEKRTINSISKTLAYTYNLDGSVATIMYPGGRTITYTPGNAQRSASAIDSTNSINYAKTATFAPSGEASSMVHGNVTGGFAGITESFTFNNRLQITADQAASSAGTALNLAFSYVSGNNGNIGTQTNNVDTGRTQSYSYDNLNRILTAQAQATSGVNCWGQTFGDGTTAGDDPLSNLLTMSVSKCTAPSLSVSVTNGSSATKNQITSPSGFSYDSAGNTTADAVLSYTYDAENRIISASGMTGGPYCYTYDGDGFRVEKSNGTSCSSAAVDVLYWRTAGGDTIAETDSTGSTTNSSYHEYVFFGGQRIARSDPSSGNVYYLFADQLGSTRAMTQADGTVCFTSDYYPYGQELSYSSGCSTNYKFTGYEQDSETGLDYAFERYYNARLGRFMSGDPLGGDVEDPQALNRYAYVGNNPINFIDPLGLSPHPPGYCKGLDVVWVPCNSTPPPPPKPPDPSGGSTSSGGATSKYCSASGYGNARNFVAANQSAATQVANSLNTTPSNLLGLSGFESGWGTGPLISAGTNNYFSLKAGPAFATGATGKKTLGSNTFWTYSSYQASAQAFASSYFGTRVNGIIDPVAFAQAMNSGGRFNSERRSTPYNSTLVNSINIANGVLQCP
jgi:RHS repeat-associated protein